jgi:hypothetical protein
MLHPVRVPPASGSLPPWMFPRGIPSAALPDSVTSPLRHAAPRQHEVRLVITRILRPLPRPMARRAAVPAPPGSAPLHSHPPALMGSSNAFQQFQSFSLPQPLLLFPAQTTHTISLSASVVSPPPRRTKAKSPTATTPPLFSSPAKPAATTSTATAFTSSAAPSIVHATPCSGILDIP